MSLEGACPCGMRGKISNRTTGSTRLQAWDVTDQNGTTHRCNWWYSSTARRYRGTCCETGRRTR